MTFLQTPRDSVRAHAWDIRTLEPPRVTPRSLAQDLAWEVRQLRGSKIKYASVVAFLMFRLLQRIAYNGGWFLGAEQ